MNVQSVLPLQVIELVVAGEVEPEHFVPPLQVIELVVAGVVAEH